MYAYCNNNPVNLQDPDGEIAISTILLIVSAIVGVASAGYTAHRTHRERGKVDVLETVASGVLGFGAVYTLGATAYMTYAHVAAATGHTPISNIGSSTKSVATNTASTTSNPGITIQSKSEIQSPTKITGYTGHGINSAISHDGFGVNQVSILNTLKNPTNITLQINGAYKFVGPKAIVVLNEAGKIVTTYPKTREAWRIK